MTTITKKTNYYLKALAALAAPMVVTAGLLAASAMPAHAEGAFTVNNTSDPGDGLCNAGGCTLRDAILATNDTPGADTINFNIPGDGLKTIKPSSALPTITEAVTIDGYSQPGASVNTLARGTNARLMVQLDGSGASGFANGLRVEASNTLVKGLAINRFSGDGIFVSGGASGVKIEGNFIGTDPSGTQDLPGNAAGVKIGLGTSANTVGGSTPAARNLISANNSHGVHLLSDTSEILGNLIGTKKDGISALGNGFSGVLLGDANAPATPSSFDGNKIGGNIASSANTIAFNGSDGVTIRDNPPPMESGNTANSVLRNSIFSNGDLGIDLGDSGPTANDAGDADSGPNELQNKPALASAKNSATATTIRGALRSEPGQTYVVRFFRNLSGENEGRVFIGQKSVTTAADGRGVFTFKPAAKVGLGQAITATATDSSGNTSEFSAPRSVVAG